MKISKKAKETPATHRAEYFIILADLPEIFVSGIFDLFNVMCRRYHTTALDPILNGRKNGTINGSVNEG